MTMPLACEFDDEHPVITAIQGGDRYAFGELVRRHSKWVRGVIFGVLGDADRVEDVAQSVWIAAWERIRELRDPARWRPWIYRLARNAAIDAGRDATRRRRRLQAFAVDAPAREAVEPTDHSVARDEQRQRVMAALQGLPAMYREPFVLRHLNGWSYQQIADVMGMPVDSIETRLVRARRMLRDMLQQTR